MQDDIDFLEQVAGDLAGSFSKRPAEGMDHMSC